MTLALFPQRPARAAADQRRELTTYTTRHPIGPSEQSRDWAVQNPWLVPALLDASDWQDERHWIAMERNPAIKRAMNARIAKLLAGGVRLEQGEGPGSAELLDLWSEWLAELPLTTIQAIALRGIFRGWEIFEAIGAFTPWRGRRGRPPVWMPAMLKDAHAWQFRWTVGRDLLFCPAGIPVAGYRMRSLPALMKWWAPCYGSVANPYGEPLHGYYAIRDYALRQLSDAGLVQIRQAQGFLRVAHGFGDGLTDQSAALTTAAKAKIKSIIAELSASGILWVPDGWSVDWVALQGAVDGWMDVFHYFDDDATSFYAGANLTTQARGTATGRAGGEVQERSSLDLAKVDAQMFAEQFRRWMRAWSAWNASTVAPRAFEAQALTPRLDDVPMRAVPRVDFRGLTRFRAEDLAVLQAVMEAGVIPDDQGEPRVDVEELLSQIRVPLLDPGQEGATLDLSRKLPPPSPFGDQSLEESLEDDDETPELDEEEQEPVRSR